MNVDLLQQESFLQEFAQQPKIHKREVFKAQVFLADAAKTQLELGKFSFRMNPKRLRSGH